MPSKANELLAESIKTEKSGQPAGLRATSTEFHELAVKIEPLQALPAEIEHSHIAPVVLIRQTHEYLKPELILEDELSVEASNSLNQSQDILETADYLQAEVSTLEESNACKARRRRFKKAFRQRILCEFCPISFTNADCLRRHMVSHDKDKERTFPCQSCGKAFFSKGNLVGHMKTHASDPDHCGVCGNHNTQKHNLRAHKKHMVCEHSEKKQRNASDPQTSNEHSEDKQQHNYAPNTSNGYSENKHQYNSSPQASNDASVSSKDDLQYICGLDSTSDSSVSSITSNDVSVQSEDNIQYTSGLQIPLDASRDPEQKAHFFSGFHISYEGFVHSENTHQSTSGSVPSNDASVHTKKELMSDEEFLDEDKGPSAQDEQRTSTSIAESQTPNDASVHPTIELMTDEEFLDEDKGPNEAQVSRKSDLLAEHEQRTSANIVHPKIPNDSSVHPTIELMSDEQSLDEESRADSYQRIAPSDLFAGDEQGTSASIAESQTSNDASVHTKTELMSDEEFLDEDKGSNSARVCRKSDLLAEDEQRASTAIADPQIPNDASVHASIEFFKCQLCPKSFLRPRYLELHMKEHSKDKEEFVCRICGKTFSSQWDVYKHRFEVHSVKKKTKTKIHFAKIHDCPVCGVVFKYRRARQNHLLRLHSDEAQELVPPTANPDSVQIQTELASAEVEKESAASAQGNIQSELFAEDEQGVSASIVDPQTSNDASVPATIELMSDDEYLEEESLADSAQRNALSDLFAEDEQGAITSIADRQTQTDTSVHATIEFFKCQLCPRYFRRPLDLKRHMVTHGGNGEFACGICRETFQDRSCLHYHRKLHNAQPFAKSSKLKKRTKHTKVRKAGHACRLCGKRFSSKWTVHTHRLKVHGGRTYDCQVCGAGFKYEKSRHSHLLRIHPAEAQEFVSKSQRANPYSVQIETELAPDEVEKESAASAQGNEQNVEVSKPPDSVTCELCHNIYPKVVFSTHMRMAHCNKAFKCKMCPRSFLFQDLLNQHMATHEEKVTHNEKEFACQTCGQTFSSSLVLIYHRKLHDKTTYECRECGAVFKWKSSRTKHMLRKHCGEAQKCIPRPQTANADAVQTQTELALNGELLEDHAGGRSAAESPQSANLSTADRSVSCGVCHNSYPKELFCSHMRLAHTERTHKCDLCVQPTVETEEMPSSPSGLLAGSAIRAEKSGQLAGLRATSTEFHELAVKIEPSQALPAEIERSDIAPVAPIPQTHGCLKPELILEDELSVEAPHAQNHSQDLRETSEHQQAKVSTAVETKTCKGKRRTYKKAFRQRILCEFCPISFTSADCLRRHMVSHDKDKERTFPCQSCGKAFFSKGNLVGHMKTHASDPDHCGVCGNHNTQKHNLRAHIKHLVCEHSEKKQRNASDPQTSDEHSQDKHQHNSASKTSNGYSENKHQYNATPQASNDASINSEDSRQYNAGVDSASDGSVPSENHKNTHESTFGPISSNDVSVQSEDNLQYTSGLQISHTVSRDSEHKPHYSSGFQISYEGFVHSENTHQFTSDSVTSKDASVHSKKESMSNSAEVSRKSDLLAEDEQGASTSTADPQTPNECFYKCQLCPRSFRRPGFLKLHMKKHSNDKEEYACQTCVRTFTSPSSLHNHTKIHFGKTHDCPVCGAAFKYEKSRHSHLLRLHPAEAQEFVSKYLRANPDCVQTETELAPDEVEKESAASAQGNEQNVEVNMPLDSVTCELCRNIYPKVVFSTHMRMAHCNKAFKCKMCPRSFLFQDLLNQHMATHEEKVTHNEKEFACQTCGQTFSSSLVLIYHRKLHDKTTYECRECGAVFKWKSSRTKHMLRKHCGEAQKCIPRPQTANADAVQTQTKLALNGELLEDHAGGRSAAESPQSANLSTADRSVSCGVCHNSYPKELFCSHMRLAHTERTHKCDLCVQSTVETEEMPSSPNGLLAGSAIRTKMSGQLAAGLRSPSTEFHEMVANTEPLEALLAEIERSDIAPVAPIPQTYECLKPELILEDELSVEAPHAQNHSQDLRETSEHQQAKVSTAVETKTCKGRRRGYKKAFRQRILCGFCPISFTNADCLRRHMVRHDKDKERTFPCQSCGKAFFSKGNLVGHMKTHASDPDHCGVCGNHNTQKHNLRAHIKHLVCEPSEKKQRNASDPQTSDEHSEDKQQHNSASKTSNGYSENKHQYNATPQASNDASINSEDSRQYNAGVDSASDGSVPSENHKNTHESTFGPITSNDVSVQSEDNLQYTSGLQISHTVSRNSEHKPHYSSGFQISYEGFVHSENTHQFTSDRVTSKDASVHSKKELMSNSAEVSRKSDLLAEDEQGASTSTADPQTPNECFYKCQLCPRSFRRPGYLKLHMKKHSKDEEEYFCQTCGRTFNCPFALRNHKKIHYGKTYDCQVCGAAFKYEKSRHSHLLRLHPVEAHEFVPTETELAPDEVEKESAASAQGNEQNVEVNMPLDSVTCELCRNIYPKVVFSTHMRMAHCNKAFKCKMCPRSFLFQDLLNQHMAIHEENVMHDKKEFACHKCKQTFSSSLVLNNHRKIHDTTCRVCTAVFKDKQSRNEHMLRAHFRGGRVDDCRECGVAFKNNSNLKMHMLRKHFGEVQHSAQNPKATNVDPFQLQTELASNEEFLEEGAGVESTQRSQQSSSISLAAVSVSCELCHHSYPKELLRTHMRMAHSEALTFKCQLCPRSFLEARYLKIHMHMHTKIRKAQYACKTRGQTFTVRRHLRNHRATHDTKRYECRVCGVAFKHKKSRNSHMLRIHPAEAQQSAPKAPTADPHSVQIETELASDEEFLEEDAGVGSTQRSQQSSSISLAADSVSCEVCHKSYPKEVFNTHVRLEHRERRRSKCELCPYSFLNLKTHMLTHAKDGKKCP